MNIYRATFVAGLVFALLFGAAGLAGYSVVLYYCWLFLFFVLLLLATLILKRQPSVTAYLCAVIILIAFSATGAFSGHWARRLHCRRKCKACEPLLTLLQQYQDEHGQYPSQLSQVRGFALAQRKTCLDVVQGKFSSNGISLDKINSHDVLIYLDRNFVLCIVPVTKRLPISVTRFYVYKWSSDTRSWKYNKLVWSWSLL